MTDKEIIEKAVSEFESRFCNNHDRPISDFLRQALQFALKQQREEIVEKIREMDEEDIPGVAYDPTIPQDVMSEMWRDMEYTMKGFNGANEQWRSKCDDLIKKLSE